MKILKVIHGYPPQYNAGSEVYTRMLSQGLSKSHQISVLCREENAFKPAFSYRCDVDQKNSKIKLHLINIPSESYRYSYRNKPLDVLTHKIVEDEQPDIVHIGHLNHLSISLIEVFAKHQLPIAFTLHDYWLMCPRGQFIRRNPSGNECWPVCNKQIDQDCAKYCYAGYYSGAEGDAELDQTYWTNWVRRRMDYVKKVVPLIDCFIAPARHLRERFIRDFNIPSEKIHYLDYGFDLERYQILSQPTRDEFTFGYIGTHIPAKGIQLLLAAFGMLKQNVRLIIWGRSREYHSKALKLFSKQFPANISSRIDWREEYQNETIAADVFAHIDCLVVPSIWMENSPLVIHEAQQARIPVITADVGGMAEYVHDHVNGLLFKHRDIDSLASVMNTMLLQPDYAKALGQNGYLYSADHNIPSMQAHITALEQLYQNVIKHREKIYA